MKTKETERWSGKRQTDREDRDRYMEMKQTDKWSGKRQADGEERDR